MNRWKAAALHLSISLLLAVSVLALLFFLWFPSPYFIAGGANHLILVLVGVDVGIGPLLTLLVVNSSKPKKLLKLDLTVIGVLQLIAFAYGIHVVAAARPVFVVAEIDRLVLVSAEQLSDADLAKGSQPEFRKRSWTGPMLVGALPPKGDKGIDMALQAMNGGKDIDQLPMFYVPYDEVIEKVMGRAKSLSQLTKATPDQHERLKLLETRTAGETLLALPLERGDDDYTAIMSATTKRPVTVMRIDPW